MNAANVRAAASEAYEAGLCPVPVRSDGSKAPAVAWRKFQDQRYGPEALQNMFSSQHRGMGVICGRASGNVEMLEFEARAVTEGVLKQFLGAAREAGVGDELADVALGYQAQSPSGGIHLMFRVDGEPMQNTKLASRPATDAELEENPDERTKVLIETRGQGGFVVTPPSNSTVHPSGKAWTIIKGGFATIVTISEATRDQLYEIAQTFHMEQQKPSPELLRPNVTEKVDGEPRGRASGHDDSSPADWVRDHVDVRQLLEEGGWTLESTRGSDTFWTRPGKDARQGHSAVLHGDAPLVVWSTSAPPEFTKLGRPNSDGSVSLSPFDVYSAVHFGGDSRAAGREVRSSFMPRTQSPPHQMSSTPGDASSDTRSEEILDDEFWTARPWLAQVRQAAEARMASPAAVLVGVLARYSALIPPSTRIPAIVGTQATFDFIGCVVAKSSGGKTIANGIADELVPSVREDVLMKQPIGSGEGLIQAMMGDELDDDGKPTGRQTYKTGPVGVHFYVDEGTALIAQKERKGTTIVQILCSAWSGSVLGQLNASKETKRIIPEKVKRSSGVISIQTANGHLMLTEEMIAVGLPQRVLFAAAENPSAPPLDEMPEFPGPIAYKVPPGIQLGTYELTYDPQIVQELREARLAVVTGQVVLGPLDGHQGLLRLKVSGMLAMIDGRRDVSTEDWALAATLLLSSAECRSHLVEVKKQADRERVVTQGTAQAERDGIAADVLRNRKVAQIRARIVTKVSKEKAITAKQLKEHFSASERTDGVYRDALDEAVTAGLIEEARVDELKGYRPFRGGSGG